MKQVIADPGWGNMIIEDTETHEFSFQCLCGGFAMYWRRIVLTQEEVNQFRAGTFDADRMLREVCREGPSVIDRFAQSFPMEQLVHLPANKE